MKHKNIGSKFDDFLEEEGLLGEIEEKALKKVIALQVELLMKEKKLSKTAMAKRMQTSRSSLDRLLDPYNESVTFYTMKKAASAVGRKLKIELA
ncbi:MAG: hypothetical protein Q7J27_10680 [Syntrophales bacterium]|nr:hypothetical protein [Syntrophales bacterium]